MRMFTGKDSATSAQRFFYPGRTLLSRGVRQ